jgi:hypothetical protein
MSRLLTRLPQMLVASTFAVSAVAASALPNSVPCDAVGVHVTSDPEEGGEVTAAKTTNGSDLKGKVNTVASDPEEGGQVTAAKTKPTIRDISVTKSGDSASAKLEQSAPPASACAPVQH